MTPDLRKRTFIKLAALSALGSASLAACSKKEEAAAPSDTAPAAAPAEALKAAWIYVGPVGSAGWSFAHDLGRKAVEAEFGDKVKTTFVESVPEGADTERVVRDLVNQGNKLIFGTSFGFMEAMLKVAQDHPDVKFEHATGYKTAANMNVYDSRFYQDTYLAGIIAGHMTKTGTLGFVGSFPIPEVLRNINAFTLGAQSVKPDVKVRVVWANTWYDPPKETEAAQSLMNSGADVLLQNTDSTAVLQAANNAGKLAFGWDSDMSAFGGEAHLGSAIADWSHYYKKTVKEVLDGTWKGNQVTRWGVPEGQNDLVKLSDKIPAEARAKVDEIKSKMKDGSFDVFNGPISDASGKERLAAGVRANDEWMGKIDFFVPGVEGNIPASK
ncbi:BMP family ABC transporter substrate-binding protein [Ottowia caeni]|uniref:BMP family ABC transporter substrate-binding protein n=1 Tax=Ottowia caeni TaxID=2870339 RepID=UPI001E53DB42|nr:BMP family ABC transporter substrate-binding protein [Ottowia caeni]